MSALPFAVFQPVPLRELRPGGWLTDFLQLQASGLTGHIEASGLPYGHVYWGRAVHSGEWWPYEQTAYWIEGALKGGYLLGEEALYQRAAAEVTGALEHAAPDGFIGPERLRAQDRWPHAVFFRAMLAQAEITNDARIVDALARHYRAAPHPMGWDRDVSGVEILVDLYEALGDPDLLAQAEALYARFNEQWPGHDCATGTLLADTPVTEHGASFNELGKLGARLYAATGNETYRRAAVNGFAKLERKAGLADGMHSCAEPVLGNTALDSHETCNLADHTWALAALLEATGAAHYADRLERVIFNALPGSVTKDFTGLQYFSCPNQVIATSASNHNRFMRGHNWMSYRPDHEIQCCPGSVNRGMPNYVSRMWLRTPAGGIVAALYGPGQINTTAGADQTPVTITAKTRYPFEETITFRVEPATPARFAFVVRIPEWCQAARVTVNGDGAGDSAALKAGSFFTLERVWEAGDVVALDLPFTLRAETWPDGGLSLTYGPLTLALPITTRAEVETENSTLAQRAAVPEASYGPVPAPQVPGFNAWNLYPAGAWNYALAVDPADLAGLKVEWNPAATDPWDAAQPALRVRVPARRVRDWDVVRTDTVEQWGHWSENGGVGRGLRTLTGAFELTPPLPDPATLAGRLAPETEMITLVPYGATLLRLTVFPRAAQE